MYGNIKKQTSVNKFMGGREKVRVAVIQAASCVFNKDKLIDKACRMIREAGANGAELVAFPECFIPVFPQIYNPGFDCNASMQERWAIGLSDNAIVVGSDDTIRIGEACRDAGVYCVMGVHEMDERPGVHTFYNTNLTFAPSGEVVARHRKLKPTFNERVYWGEGDGSDFGVINTPIGRIGSLICWEHHTIGVRAAQMLLGEEFHVATWSGTWEFKHQPSGRCLGPNTHPMGDNCDAHMADMEYAFESGAFVLSAHNLLREEDFEPEYKDFFDDPHMTIWQVGGACILDPMGNYIAEPVYNEETIVYGDCYANLLKVKKFFFDGLGHYSRPDVVSLHLNTKHNENLILNTSNSAPSYNFVKQASEMCEVELQKVEQLAAKYEELLSKGGLK